MGQNSTTYQFRKWRNFPLCFVQKKAEFSKKKVEFTLRLCVEGAGFLKKVERILKICVERAGCFLKLLGQGGGFLLELSELKLCKECCGIFTRALCTGTRRRNFHQSSVQKEVELSLENRGNGGGRIFIRAQFTKFRRRWYFHQSSVMRRDFH